MADDPPMSLFQSQCHDCDFMGGQPSNQEDAHEEWRRHHPKPSSHRFKWERVEFDTSHLRPTGYETGKLPPFDDPGTTTKR
jgi:hypothetical protein